MTNQVTFSTFFPLCDSVPLDFKSVNATLDALYENDLLDQSTIMLWYEKGCSVVVALADASTSKKTRKNAKKFVNWLENAEEESEED